MKTLKVTLNDNTTEIYEDVIRAYTDNHLKHDLTTKRLVYRYRRSRLLTV